MENSAHIPVELQRHIDKRIREGIARYRRQAIAGFVILLVGLGLAAHVESKHNSAQRTEIRDQATQSQHAIVSSGDAVAVSDCNRDYNTIDGLRDELERSLIRLDQLEKDGVYTHAQAQAGRDSTFDILQRYTLPDCRLADDVLTANPGKAIIVPKPRYPDDPQQREDEKRETKELGRPSDVP